MTQEAMNNAIVLFDLKIPREEIQEADALYSSSPELRKFLNSPVIPYQKKQQIVDAVFGANGYQVEFVNFLKKMCEYQMIQGLKDIFEGFYQYSDLQNKILRVDLSYVTKPDQAEYARINQFLENKYPEQNIVLKEKEDPALLGGIFMKVGHEEYDWSFEGSMKQLERKLTGR